MSAKVAARSAMPQPSGRPLAIQNGIPLSLRSTPRVSQVKCGSTRPVEARSKGLREHQTHGGEGCFGGEPSASGYVGGLCASRTIAACAKAPRYLQKPVVFRRLVLRRRQGARVRLSFTTG